MKYILYHELQNYITGHYHATGETLSFANAMRACLEEGIFHEGKLPAVDFLGCDLTDPDAICARIDQLAIPFITATMTLENGATQPTEVIVFKYPDHSRAGIHVQNGLELNYVFKGSCTMNFEGTEYQLHENDIVIIPPHAHHDVYDTEGSIVFSFLIHQDYFNETFFQVIQSDTALSSYCNNVLYQKANFFLNFHIHDSGQFLSTFLAMYAEFTTDNQYRYEICINYIRILFAHLLRESRPTIHDNSLNTGETILLDMPAIIHYVMSHFRTLSLQDLAEKFHYNRSYLGKQLRKYTGTTFTEMVNGYRLQLARTLLENSTQSIEAISEQCGYASATHFTRSFKQTYHCAPSVYRKQHARE